MSTTRSPTSPASPAASPGPPAPARRPRRWPLQAAAVGLGLLPLVRIVWDGLAGRLGANPIERVQDRLGFWTLTFLALSLVATPAHDLLGLAWPVRVRRTIGLLAFAYASLHLVWYVGIDQVGDVGLLVKDVTKRRFMAVGFVAWLILVPLAVTSTQRWVRRLGYVRWKRLHRLVYAAALLGVVHFVWRVKADLRRPILVRAGDRGAAGAPPRPAAATPRAAGLARERLGCAPA